MERRLAAIMVADVVGYSRLMGADELGTLERLKSLRKELVQPKIAEHGGSVVKLMGDGHLAEFPSVVNSVQCAVDIQEMAAERDLDVPKDGRIRLRIGINLGDIIHEGSDIYGDGVNVAARLEGLSDPGGICISGSVYDQLRDRLHLLFEDMGERLVKNIDRPVRAWRWTKVPAQAPSKSEARAETMPSDRPAIAVLPFINMSPDPEQEYFSDGLTEDVITALTYWRQFPVIARNSCFAYKNKVVDIKQAGRELGARYLLEGSVRKSGNRVRITTQLIDGDSGHHVWAQKYDRALDDIFAVQDDIVQRIVAVAAPEMAKAELRRLTDKRAKDLDAWDLFIRALPLVRERTQEGNAKARDLFLRAIAIRPDYSDAYAGLAMSYQQDILIGVAENRSATATKAMDAARKAIEHDEASSWAHHELSTAYQWLNRLDDALDEARVSVDLNPNDAYAIHALGNKSDLAGDPRGLRLMEKAQKLNPEDARRHTHLTFLARAYLNAGDHNNAIDRSRQAIRRSPNYAPAYFILAIALAKLGNLEEARAALCKCDEISPGFVASRREWRPYADPASNERLQEGLRRTEG